MPLIAALASFVAVLASLSALSRSAAAAELWTVDGAGVARAAHAARATLQRTPPEASPSDAHRPSGDPDALRYLLAGLEAELPAVVDVLSLAPDGAVIGELRSVALEVVPCPAPVAQPACAVTEPLRAVADEIDARHPLVARRSLVATLGGAVAIHAPGGARVGVVRVLGPRETPAGGIDRMRARMRFVMVRLAPGGAVPVGGDAAGAERIASDALARLNALWGSCGISFGDEPLVELRDPPPPHLLVVGCDHGLPASGGRIALTAAGLPIEVVIDAGMTPAEAARRVAMALERAGLTALVSDNPRMAAGAGASADISVRDQSGALVTLAAPARGPLSTDATLTTCIGGVNVEDGLQHFGDVDSMLGTIEERALVRGLDDGDPTTIDVVLVPGFARGGRIGESFIGQDGAAIRNVVVVDRAGLRENRASFTLAHEIGHVLLDDPGHPDDFGRDLPTRLMDADASDPTAHGPRRLTLDECARVIRQSGPAAPVPLLSPWPLEER